MGAKLSDKEKKEIIAYYRDNGENMSLTARAFKRGKATVKAIIDTQFERYPEFANEIEQVKNNNSKEIIAAMSDNKTMKIIDNFKDILLDKKLMKELVYQKGPQFVINGIGMLNDKVLKLKDLEIKELQSKNGINVNINKEQLELMKQIEQFTKDANK